MNKFQKVAAKVVRENSKKVDYELTDNYKGKNYTRAVRQYVKIFKYKKWTYNECLDYKNWNKTLDW